MSDLHGSRIGMMEFRDPNAQMDSDLTGKDNDTVAQTEKETSAYPNGQTNAGNETPMEEAMQEPKGTGDRMQMLLWKQWSGIWSQNLWIRQEQVQKQWSRRWELLKPMEQRRNPMQEQHRKKQVLQMAKEDAGFSDGDLAKRNDV